MEPQVHQIPIQRRKKIILTKHMIGQGGYGQVFLAKYVVASKAQFVAVKKVSIQQNLSSKEEARKRSLIVRQQQHLEKFRKSNNPYIVYLLDFTQFHDEYFYIFPQYEFSLSTLVNFKGEIEGLKPYYNYFQNKYYLKEQYLLRIISQVIKSISDIHSEENGIAHRDIKPSNFLLRKQGKQLSNFVVSCIDFGVSSKGERGPSEKVTVSTFAGTHTYQAPQLIKSFLNTLERKGQRQRKFNESLCDSWSLGIMISELLIQERFFKKSQVFQAQKEKFNYDEYIKLVTQRQMQIFAFAKNCQKYGYSPNFSKHIHTFLKMFLEIKIDDRTSIRSFREGQKSFKSAYQFLVTDNLENNIPPIKDEMKFFFDEGLLRKKYPQLFDKQAQSIPMESSLEMKTEPNKKIGKVKIIQHNSNSMTAEEFQEIINCFTDS